MSRVVGDAAAEARGALERVLDLMGWPPYERALSRAVDRLLQLEEAAQAERAEAFFTKFRRAEQFSARYWAYRRDGCNSTTACQRAQEDLRER